jgi:hypothetical protein
MKLTKQLRKQARIAEAASKTTQDKEASSSLANLADAFRAQAAVLAAKKKKGNRKKKSAKA